MQETLHVHTYMACKITMQLPTDTYNFEKYLTQSTKHMHITVIQIQIELHYMLCPLKIKGGHTLCGYARFQSIEKKVFERRIKSHHGTVGKLFL